MECHPDFRYQICITAGRRPACYGIAVLSFLLLFCLFSGQMPQLLIQIYVHYIAYPIVDQR